MSFCFLCIEETYNIKCYDIHQYLYHNYTIEAAIQDYFSCYKIIFESESNSVCESCYNLLKTFHEFTTKVNTFYSANLNVASPDLSTLDDNIEYDEEYIDEDITECDGNECIETEESNYNFTVLEKFSQNFNKNSPNLDVNWINNQNITIQNHNQSSIKDCLHNNSTKISKNDQKISRFVEIKCQICSIEFETFPHLCRHFKLNHSDKKPYLICCNRRFMHQNTLLNHLKYHDLKKTHKCKLCEKEFKTKAILLRHERKVHTESQESTVHGCVVCGKHYTNKYILKTHMRKHIVDNEKSYECYICKKTMKNMSHLLDHFKYKHDPAYVKSSICHICSKIVTRLDIHLRQVHSTDPIERVKCDICGHWMKKSSFKGHLVNHNQTGYSCNLCGKFLKNKNSFLCHMKRTHTEGKFKCEYCGKSFHQNNRLVDHIACQHTGNYIYHCRIEVCGKMFRNSGRRRMHERRMHPKEYEKKFRATYLRENLDEKIN